MENVILGANAIELHYWFDDETHSMDALIQHKCEAQILSIIKTISKTFEVDIAIETEPLSNGGLKCWFKVVNKTEGKNATITVAIIISLLTTIIITPVGSSLTKILEKLIEAKFEDKELKELEKEKNRQEIENLKADTKQKTERLSNNTVVVKKRSDFYETLESYPKVIKVSFEIQNDKKEKVAPEYFITRQQFSGYVLASDALPEVSIDDATIEIISPVLKKGNYKWRGIYNGEVHSFNMKSNEFKSLVQTRQIEFKNGSAIKCALELQMALNSEGHKEVREYSIIRVNEYFENDVPVETPEGRSYKQKVAAEKNQLKLF
ncbi:hypothetical protein CJD36_003990 [Flavipsychrobacter stenotrophus]|uniref:Uncharacterized protein n=1 Tax=Flavipsychrobacter stenotrophus TaxID=2077091 RepID=A0A2S7T2D4_9BACT|nr:hypothetical protein [Flavipsychrobacter stenotrophus]PQJ12916.1 hypothetical protein CJD36_003990 [Flavipsychrobacter stenotrophus]